MIFVTGPLFAGKKEYIKRAMKLSEADFATCAVWDVHQLTEQEQNLTVLADRLACKRIVIGVEMGGGVVPVDAAQRRQREDAGRLACLLAARAETVVRVCCGLPQLLKGEWPC